jgi:GT2 family glycosyltransferase
MDSTGRSGCQLPRVAAIVLNYNTAELTDALANYLRNGLDYPEKRVFIVDNGSLSPPSSSTHVLPQNLGFTRGMHEAYLSARQDSPYDAYWFLHSDVAFDNGNNVLTNLIQVLFSSERFGQISAQQNSPHRFMESANAEAQPVPFLHHTATLVKSSTIANVGFWDLDLTEGWGVDYDYGYRVRQANLQNILTDRARITHREHQTTRNDPDFVRRAQAQMQALLSQKYGEHWGRILSMTGEIVPLILTCDRQTSLTAKFVDSYKQTFSGSNRPVVAIDLSSSPRISPDYLELILSLNPRSIHVHPREANMSVYDSVQEATNFSLAHVLAETKPHDLILFLEDDIRFSKNFLDELYRLPVAPDTGFVTLYLPGDGYGGRVVNRDQFYGTQCILFPRWSVEELVRDFEYIKDNFMPGYDIRWSRYLAECGYTIYCTERSLVQHMGSVSRLHGHDSHVSNCFVEE